MSSASRSKLVNRRLLSSDPDRQGDFGEQAVKAQIDNLDRARSIAGGIAAKFRTHRDPGGHPPFGFRRSSGPRPILEPDPDGIAAAVLLFELYGSGLYSDDTLALEAARRGLVSRRTGRVLTAAGMAELLRNPIYNGYLVRFRGFADEQTVEAPWRHRPPDLTWRASLDLCSTLETRAGGPMWNVRWPWHPILPPRRARPSWSRVPRRWALSGASATATERDRARP